MHIHLDLLWSSTSHPLYILVSMPSMTYSHSLHTVICTDSHCPSHILSSYSYMSTLMRSCPSLVHSLPLSYSRESYTCHYILPHMPPWTPHASTPTHPTHSHRIQGISWDYLLWIPSGGSWNGRSQQIVMITLDILYNDNIIHCLSMYMLWLWVSSSI